MFDALAVVLERLRTVTEVHSAVMLQSPPSDQSTEDNMSRFKFCDAEGRDIEPREWLELWSRAYKPVDEAEYGNLVSKHNSLSGADFELIGRWQDDALTETKHKARWKPNMARVAYPIWIQASAELPTCPASDGVEEFLVNWSERKYTDKYKNGTTRELRFGLSRATTLLHFISGGKFPIFDSRVKKSIHHLANLKPKDTVQWYVRSFLPLFRELLAICGTENVRELDRALFSHGAKLSRSEDR